MQKAVHNVNNLIAPEIVAKCLDPVEQEKIDGLMLVSFRVGEVLTLVLIFRLLMVRTTRTSWEQMLFWEFLWLCVRRELLIKVGPS